MTNDSLELKLAESRLQQLENEMDPILAAHHEANACHECEKSIKSSIVVYESISTAEKTMLDADREGVQVFDDEQHRGIKLIYERWLALGMKLEREAQEFSKNGYVIRDYKRFLECYEGVSDWLERNEWKESARSLTHKRFSQEIAYTLQLELKSEPKSDAGPAV